jgi:Ni/Fe-hydrogenase subunit HybB-like protein
MSAISAEAAPVLEGAQSYASVTDRIVGIPTQRPGLGWLGGFGIAFALVMMMGVSIMWLFLRGVGIWGINIPVGWGFAIVNFVWWIGIGHAGTLISAILLLLRQEWRTSINRFAEAMTLFAVANAGLFPLLHLGRAWKFFYMTPYPDTLGLWPQWRSPLLWDMCAVATYATVSLLFWYTGLIPDLATLRDTARSKRVRIAAGIFAMGWRGSARHWQRYEMAYLLLAGMATPLVVSVHSIVSLDFAVSIVPGWHTTIFPPYWVAGAIYSGFAMVLTIAIPLRVAYGFRDLITERHIDNMAKLLLFFGLIVIYGYIMETFTGFYGGDPFDWYYMRHRMVGEYAPIFWTMVACNVVILQLLWFRWVRTHPPVLFVIAILCNIGIWCDHFTVIVTALHRDYMPSAWGLYFPTVWDWTLLFGSLGFFTFLLFLFIRFVPMISTSEMRKLVHAKGLEPPGGFTEGRKGNEEGPSSLSARSSVGREEEDQADEIPDPLLYGVAAEFGTPEAVTRAARGVREAGYRRIDAYSSFAVDGLAEALGLRRTRVPALALIGAILGGVSAYLLCWYSSVIDYPWNIGGRPHDSWPAYIPITFECAVLGGTLFTVIGMLALNRLPKPYHPVFNAPDFRRAARDRFFLCIEKRDPRFDRQEARRLLERCGAIRVSDVRK